MNPNSCHSLTKAQTPIITSQAPERRLPHAATPGSGGRQPHGAHHDQHQRPPRAYQPRVGHEIPVHQQRHPHRDDDEADGDLAGVRSALAVRLRHVHAPTIRRRSPGWARFPANYAGRAVNGGQATGIGDRGSGLGASGRARDQGRIRDRDGLGPGGNDAAGLQRGYLSGRPASRRALRSASSACWTSRVAAAFARSLLASLYLSSAF